MNKKFVINLGLLLLLNFLVKPFYILGIDGEIQNRVGQEIYGQYFSLLGLTFLLNIILDVGIVNYNTRNIAQHNFLLTKYFPYIIALRLILSAFFGVSVILTWWFLGYSFDTFYMIIWLIVNQIIMGFILYIRSNLTGLHLFKQDSVISVLDRFLMVAICAILLWGGITSTPFKIEWLIYTQTAAYLITLGLALYFLTKNAKPKLFKYKRAVSINILKQSLPYAVLILLMVIYYRIDSVMIERMLPDGKLQAGIYANAFRFFEAGNNIASLFAVILLPVFAKLIKQKEKVDSLVVTASKLLIPGGIVIVIISFFYSKELMGARYDDYIDQSAPVFSLLMSCFFFVSCTYIFGTLLTANGSLKILNRVALSGALLNVILNIILIPYYKAFGAALASLITQGVTAIIQIAIASQLFKLKVNPKLIGSFMLFSLIIVVSSYALKHHFNFINSWWLQIIILLLMSILLIVGIGLIRINDLKTLILSYKSNRNE